MGLFRFAMPYISHFAVLFSPIYWVSWKTASLSEAKNKLLQKVHLPTKLFCCLDHMTQQIQFC